MPNIMSVLKAEIARLARKEAKQIVAPVKKTSANYRGLIAGLRKQVGALQKEIAALKISTPKAEKAIAEIEPQGRFWISGKGVRTLRKRLGLTQAQFAKLAGVSVQSVVNWEAAKGKAPIRRKTSIARMQQIRGLRKRQLAEIMGKGKAKAPKKPKTRAKPKVQAKRKAKKA